MQLNPEFRRYLWLEMTPHRLIAMPAILGAIFWLVWLASSMPAGNLAVAALFLFNIIALLWGSRLAASAVVSEVRDATWDWQRMSAIRPWQMTWGKLLGSAVFPWYGAVICLLVYGTTMAVNGHVLRAVESVAASLFAAFLAHAVALAVSLLWLRKFESASRAVVAMPQLLGLTTGVLAVSYWSKWQGTDDPWWSGGGWHGLGIDLEAFVIASLGVFLAWATLAVYRLIQTELQVRQRPWAWPAFTLFLMVFIDGFHTGICASCGEGAAGRLLLPFLATLGLAYLALLVFPKDAVQARALNLAVKARAWRRTVRLMPLWLIAVAIALVVGTALAGALAWSTSVPAAAQGMPVLTLDPRAALIIGALLVFLLRDLGIILLLNLRGQGWRADTAALIYLLALHLLLPTIAAMGGGPGLTGLLTGFGDLGLLVYGVMGFMPGWSDFLAATVLAGLGSVSALALVSGAVQAAAVFYCVYRRWSAIQADFQRSLANGGAAP